ncbi:MAG: fibronectin type III domain-containing protein [Bacteriovoracaceae bacterium]|nr:fibronectin type III domain-containing protein [Bacteriovoracaceae bacterium]
MKPINLLFLITLASCGAKNNIFYDAAKVASDTIGTILPGQTAPQISIISPVQSSLNGTVIKVSGTCDADRIEISGSLIATPISANCTNGSFEKTVELSSSSDTNTSIVAKAIRGSDFDSASVDISLSVEKPLLATHIETVKASVDSIEVEWNASGSSILSLQGYKLEYKKSSDTSWIVDEELISATSKRIEGLDPATEYDFRVSAFNGNYSGYSNLSQETMPDNDFFKDTYKAINVAGATTSSVVAIEDTDLYLNGAFLVSIAKGITHVFNSNQYDVLSGSGAFYVAGRLDTGSNSNVRKANMVWTTQDWAAKNLSFTVSRAQAHKLSVVSFESSTVKVFKGTSLVHTQNLAQDTGFTLTLAQNGAYRIESTGVVSAYIVSTASSGNNLQDPYPILPAATDIIGYPSRWANISAKLDNTTIDGLFSNDTSINHVIATTASALQINSTSTIGLYQGDSLRLKSDKPILATSYADRNGNCSAPFISRAKMKTTYAINVMSEWVAFASIKAGSIIATKPDGTTQSVALTKSGNDLNAPYKARVTNMPAGTIFKADVKMGAWYEPKVDTAAANDDETILYGFNL